MSIFGKAWRVLKSARHAVGVIADVGDAVFAILGIHDRKAEKVLDAVKKADAVAGKIEHVTGADGGDKPAA